MRTLYLDCGMGAAGDMLAAALLELTPDPQAMLDRLNALGLPGVRFTAEPAVKCGVTGTHLKVTVDGTEETEQMHEHEHGHEHTHAHHGLADIGHLIEAHTALPEQVQKDVLEVYRRIAAAESKVHGVPVEQIHFHEVGAMDAVADITAVCLLLRELAPDRVICSPVCTGFGAVRCAHGILPVPAPATALLLEGIPVYAGEIRGELCTPTGAALLRQFATEFSQMPVMTPEVVGYGMGKKDFPRANCVRVILGQTQDGAQETDLVLELSCQVDDMTGEDLAYAMDRLLEGGALDVLTVPVGMKKGRPGLQLQLLCRPEDKERMLRLLFLHTTTIGVRETPHRRYVLRRQTETADSPWGPVRRKVSEGWGVTRIKYEYEDLARLADENRLSLSQIRSRLEKETR